MIASLTPPANDEKRGEDRGSFDARLRQLEVAEISNRDLTEQLAAANTVIDLQQEAIDDLNRKIGGKSADIERLEKEVERLLPLAEVGKEFNADKAAWIDEGVTAYSRCEEASNVHWTDSVKADCEALDLGFAIVPGSGTKISLQARIQVVAKACLVQS